MDIWLLEWNHPASNNKSISYWDSKESASKCACARIQEFITDKWDFPHCSLSQFAIAEMVNDFIMNFRYNLAVNAWNQCTYNLNDNDAHFWYVYSDYTSSEAEADAPLIRPKSDFTHTVQGSIASAAAPPAPYQATTHGAICRKCDSVSPDAYADNPDGTFVCYGCKLFVKKFGG